jgi:AcrR family transcriptional regulator
MNDLGQAAVSADKAPRTERGRRTVRKLLEAAAQEFGQRGFHEAAITGITSRAGVALGTFYTYFESKEELFRALVRDMSQATRAHVATTSPGATPAWRSPAASACARRPSSARDQTTGPPRRWPITAGAAASCARRSTRWPKVGSSIGRAFRQTSGATIADRAPTCSIGLRGRLRAARRVGPTAGGRVPPGSGLRLTAALPHAAAPLRARRPIAR